MLDKSHHNFPEKNVPLIAGIIGGKCPRCRKENMFRFPFWNIFNFAKQNTACKVCGQDFLIEPGFYYGAMYFTYIVNVAAIIVSLTLLYFVFHIEDPFWLSLPVAGIIAALVPLNFRLSRVLWLYFFGDVKYKPGIYTENSRNSSQPHDPNSGF